MSTSFTRTRLEVARRVLGKVTKMSPAQASVASADLDTVNEALDLRLKEMSKLGTFWRKVTSVPVTFSLAASVATASAGAGDILFPMKVTFTNTSNDDPVYIIGMREYAEIEDKGRTGNPEKVMWKGGSEFIFHPVPTSDGTAKLRYERIADDTSAGAAIDVDVSMIRWMRDIICYDCGDYFRKEDSLMMRYKQEADIAEKNIRKLNAQRVDYAPVAVDDFSSPRNSRETDYGDG